MGFLESNIRYKMASTTMERTLEYKFGLVLSWLWFHLYDKKMFKFMNWTCTSMAHMNQAIKEAHDQLNLELWVYPQLIALIPTRYSNWRWHKALWCILVVGICKKVNYLSNDKGILCFFFFFFFFFGFFTFGLGSGKQIL